MAKRYDRMKKAWMMRAGLLAAYCIPFAFLSVHGDALSGTMLYYGGMIAGLAGLCWGALKTNSVAVVYIGNVLSFASSWLAAKWFGMEPMGDYFKPFTAYTLMTIIAMVSMAMHTAVVIIYMKRKARE